MDERGHDIELLRRCYEAWNRGDIGTVLQATRPDFTWSAPEEIVGARGGRGRRQFERYLRGFSQVWDAFRCQPEEFRVHSDRVLVVVREEGRGRLSGARVQQRLVHVWTFRQGRASHLESHLLENRAAWQQRSRSGALLPTAAAPEPALVSA